MGNSVLRNRLSDRSAIFCCRSNDVILTRCWESFGIIGNEEVVGSRLYGGLAGWLIDWLPGCLIAW